VAQLWSLLILLVLGALWSVHAARRRAEGAEG